MNIVERRVIDNKGLRVIKLQREYQNEKNLIDLIEKIGKFRRESKYDYNSKGFDQNLKDIVVKMREKPKL